MLVKYGENNEVVQYPYFFKDLRADNSNVSFLDEDELTDELLAHFNVAKVVRHNIQSASIYQDTVELPPQFIDGKFHETYEVIDKSETEKAEIKQAAQMSMWQLIQSKREEEKQKGVSVNGFQFHGDDASRIQYLGMAQIGDNMPPGIMWKTKTGAFVEMSPLLVSQIIGAIAYGDSQIFMVAEAHKAAMLEMDNPFDYDLSVW